MEEGKQTVDLNGEFRFKIDAKGRMSLPAKFRKLLSSDLTVTRNLESECLYVFDDGEFNEWVNQLFVDRFDGYNSANPAHVKLRRKLKSRANDVQLDSAGRITLSAEMRSEVGIGKEVVIVGNTGYFEVWDAKRYDEMDAEVDLLEMLRIHD
jgi:MraZ protein